MTKFEKDVMLAVQRLALVRDGATTKAIYVTT